MEEEAQRHYLGVEYEHCGDDGEKVHLVGHDRSASVRDVICRRGGDQLRLTTALHSLSRSQPTWAL